MILAAGLGTRLRPLTDTRPKALVEVNGETLLAHVVSILKKSGFDDFVINVHHFAEMIEAYLAEHGNYGCRFSVSREDRLLNTGGGIRHAEDLLKGNGRFLVHNVDIFSNLDIPEMVKKSPEDALSVLLVSPRKTNRYLLFDESSRLVGWTNVDTGEVKSPYPGLNPENFTRLAFGGVHYMSDDVFPLMRRWPDEFSIVDFYLQNAREYPIYGYVQDNLELMDVGKVSALEQLSDFLKRF